MIQQEARVQELLDTVLGGAPTDAECDELRRLLDQQPELRPSVISQLRTHSLLMWMLSPSAGAEGDAGPHLVGYQAVQAVPSLRSVVAGQRRYWYWFTASILVALLSAGALWGRLGGASHEALGKVLDSSGVAFGEATTALLAEAGDRFAAGVIEIDSGRLALEFASGVSVELIGPARCSVVDGMLVRLEEGQATADVPRWARGFTIATPAIDVVDLGTRFGVATRVSGKTDVVVFEGEVDLKAPAASEERFERRLTQGEAARVDPRGKIERIFQVHGESLGGHWSTLDRPEGGAIAAVWDHFEARESVGFYQVIASGLLEDAPAYVDHPHQWNGVDADGLPSELRGADYVRTANDYRYLPRLSLNVEFAENATLYLFFDQRTAPPEWLAAGFEKTAMVVGLDEDAWQGNPSYVLERGAGRSVDNRFDVWRRRCAAGETVVLGSMGDGDEARAMYGLAVVAE
ncbi:FecR protein [Pseudobythopirellula maris]|uniref:FecR protein n=1 Tax=Pseudobythopirellula maris TaxID=2527991 RepID=A0A5C5ZS62_9BACT|nr:FecR family protein [Pseudobythopirellula maris]TWT89787.1 FecR protein [Pseudobythopirellula maris]